MATSSSEIVMKWANLAGLPAGGDDLKVLWAGSGRPQASNWNAGAAYLAEELEPFARPGQQIDQAYIEGLSPSTVDELASELGW